MGNYINSKKFMQYLDDMETMGFSGCAFYGLREYIEKNSEDIAPVVHAHWIRTANTWTHDYDEASKPVYRCSKCGRIEKTQEPFCNCGAKMDGDKNG